MNRRVVVCFLASCLAAQGTRAADPVAFDPKLLDAFVARPIGPARVTWNLSRLTTGPEPEQP